MYEINKNSITIETNFQFLIDSLQFNMALSSMLGPVFLLQAI